jgi:hypothetical protein
MGMVSLDVLFFVMLYYFSSYPVLASFFWLQTHFMTVVMCLCIPFMDLNSFSVFFLAIYFSI